MLRSQMEDDAQEELRLAKDKADKQFKKRLQDKENLWQAKFEEIEQEVADLNEAHRVEIKNEKERWEARLGGQMRS
jgi:F0F1-type ATP synthase membrane subunit b/b'